MILKLTRTRKAISPIIAALLLIVVSVAAAIVTYSWVMSMVGSKSEQAQTSIRIDDVQFYRNTENSNDSIKVSVRNTGPKAAVIQTIYIYKGSVQIVRADGFEFTVNAGELKTFGISEGSEWETSVGGEVPDAMISQPFKEDLSVLTAYTIKVVTFDGFEVQGTYYTPSSWS